MPSGNKIRGWSVRKKIRRSPGRLMTKENSREEWSQSEPEDLASGLLEGAGTILRFASFLWFWGFGALFASCCVFVQMLQELQNNVIAGAFSFDCLVMEIFFVC